MPDSLVLKCWCWCRCSSSVMLVAAGAINSVRGVVVVVVVVVVVISWHVKPYLWLMLMFAVSAVVFSIAAR